MDTVKIHVSVDKALAIASGKTRYGATTYEPTEENLATLTPEERYSFAAYDGEAHSIYLCHLIVGASQYCQFNFPRVLNLDLAEITWDVIVSSLRRDLVAARKKQAQCEEDARQADAQKEQQEIKRRASADEWLALPREKQVVRNQPLSKTDCSYHTTADYSIKTVTRVSARCSELAHYCKEREAADLAGIAKKDAPWRDLCREYVIRCVPEFARAATDGCDVSSVAIKALRAEIWRRLGEASGITVVDSYAERCQGLPRSFAYERLDQVRVLVARLANHPLISSIDSSVVRADLDPRRGHENWRTCVAVEAVLANGDSLDTVYVCAEESCGEGDGAEDDY